MKQQTLDTKKIDTLRDIPDMIPVLRDFYEDWDIKVFNREIHECRNYLSPNRREFYKVLLITKGAGIFTLGLNTYHIEKPTLLFIHPNDIISWRNLSEDPGGYYVLFKKSYINQHALLKAAIEKFNLFTDKSKSIIALEEKSLTAVNDIFRRMEEEDKTRNEHKGDALQAYLQLLLVESMRAAHFPKPDLVTDEYHYIHQFFNLLEEETAGVNYDNPIKMKTAKEFAAGLAIHPNHLNALMKKHTGQNVSTHIKNRLLEETKVLLLQTGWSLQDISFSMGFSDQPNFNLFFKKNTGLTPNEFRKSYLSTTYQS
jgi:AraC family transcriptional activator of pobA